MPTPKTFEYRARKAMKWCQRMPSLVAFGFILILSSHWIPDEGEREWMRDTGSAVIGIAAARWWAQQGKRRVDNKGQELRTPTLRIPSHQVDRFEKWFGGRKNDG